MLPDNGLRGDSAILVGRRQGALTGSVFSRVPVVLVEMCVLTNPGDARLIASPGGVDAMASALAAGVLAAVGTDARSGPRPK